MKLLFFQERYHTLGIIFPFSTVGKCPRLTVIPVGLSHKQHFWKCLLQRTIFLCGFHLTPSLASLMNLVHSSASSWLFGSLYQKYISTKIWTLGTFLRKVSWHNVIYVPKPMHILRTCITGTHVHRARWCVHHYYLINFRSFLNFGAKTWYAAMLFGLLQQE